MKVTKISIKDFHQFKDLDLDLTYPAGHLKAGLPLDKVCFIGQSGTGKTTLLELIPKFIHDYNTNSFSSESQEYYEQIKTTIVFGLSNEFSLEIGFEKNDDSVPWGWKILGTYSNDEERDEKWKEAIDYFEKEWIAGIASKIIYFPANLNFDIDAEPGVGFNNDAIIDFSKEKVSVVWNLLLDNIQKYQEQELQIRQEISKTVELSSNDLETIKKALTKLEEWKRTEFNPIADVAENCLDSLLANFKVRVKRELDIKKREDIGFIKIEDFNKNEIPHHLWSTGTKQVVLSALPLYLLKPKRTIILFDEPERSLYPDLQRLIIEYYKSLTEDCQFFYSTHSPVIASSFEPWEIVELKFDKEGYIYRELYYEKENHVDNYKLNPQTMRWDDILQRIFDMENDGSEERKRKLDELATLNVKYKKLVKAGESDTERAKELLVEIQKLSKELSKWD